MDSLWPSDLYRVGAHVLWGRDSHLWSGDVYRLAVKRPLDADYYQGLRMKLYGLRTSRWNDRPG
ncbi:MAG: hypothetical protein OXN89_16150 [Bryobacterales bacterium]|nr:hypothetical protein [Bryobacterales bacterium]